MSANLSFLSTKSLSFPLADNEPPFERTTLGINRVPYTRDIAVSYLPMMSAQVSFNDAGVESSLISSSLCVSRTCVKLRSCSAARTETTFTNFSF